MGDHLVLMVDRDSNTAAILPWVNEEKIMNCSPKLNSQTNLCRRKLVECRICQDEDEDSRMEAPCSCCGSLKYAHRRCVQRWCNEKGDTLCEICHQQFKPGYTAPPPLFHFGGIPTNLRGSWEIGRTELSNPTHIMTMVSTHRNFLHPNYEHSPNLTSTSFIYCCSVTIIFTVLLVLRHTLPSLVSGTENNAFPSLMLLILRCMGIILPIYIILTAFIARRRRRHQQVANASFSLSNEDADMATTLNQSHIVHSH